MELNGTLRGRLDYSPGVKAGANVGMRDTENAYAHVGYKIGGMPLDAEGKSGPADPLKPWAKTALTLQGFTYRAVSHFAPTGKTWSVTVRPPSALPHEPSGAPWS
jgi:hypothetical protein